MIIFRRLHLGAALKHCIQTRNMTGLPSVDIDNENVVFEIKDDCGIITLNRPKALNAINKVMADAIHDHLKEWENKVSMIILKGAGRAFCAGGDIRECAERGPTDCDEAKNFFKTDYKNDYIIANYKQPIIAIMNGVTMGSGVGLGVHSRYKVATEKTTMAMPETAIGLFPDVGASYFLPKLPGELGIYLALTGHRLNASDCYTSGLASHYCRSDDVPKLIEDLLKTKGNIGEIETALVNVTRNADISPFGLSNRLPLINRIFGLPTVEDMFKALEEEGSYWSRSTLKVLKDMSPFSLKVTHKEMLNGRSLNLKECLKMEYRLCHNALEAAATKDFYEGVRALMIDKNRRPNWNPTKLEDVQMTRVLSYFRPLPLGKELEL